MLDKMRDEIHDICNQLERKRYSVPCKKTGTSTGIISTPRSAMAPKGREQRASKHVAFNSRCRIRLIPATSPEDLLNAWYQIADYKTFKTDCVRTLKTVLKLHNGESPSCHKYQTMVVDISEDSMLQVNESWNGLDVNLPRRTSLRKERRHFVWDAILELQEEKRKKMTQPIKLLFKNKRVLWDPSWTVERCSVVSDASATDAHRSALVLATQVSGLRTRKYNTETSNSVRRDFMWVGGAPRVVVDEAEKRSVVSPMA